jgi:hypothetical protein
VKEGENLFYPCPYLSTLIPFHTWPAPDSEDTELGVFMEPEVSHGETKVYPGVQV